MTETIWIIEAIRRLLSGEPLEPLMQSDGFLWTMILLAGALPATLIALGIGVHRWHETPLGQWLGASTPEDDDPLTTVEIIQRHKRSWSRDGRPL
jgi:hypothetical protein